MTVAASLPGFIRTRFHEERLGVDRPGPGWIWLSVQQVVTAFLRDARRGKVVSVPGVSYALAARIARFVPRSLVRWGSTGFSLADETITEFAAVTVATRRMKLSLELFSARPVTWGSIRCSGSPKGALAA